MRLSSVPPTRLSARSVGLLWLLSPLLFTMFVMMALVTTFATTPILQALRRGEDKAHVVAA